MDGMNNKNNNPTNSRKVKKIKKFWQDGFSLDESRISALIIILFIMIAFILIMMITGVPIPDVPPGVKDIITTLIWAICGVNVFNKVSNFFNPHNRNNSNYGNYDYGYNNYNYTSTNSANEYYDPSVMQDPTGYPNDIGRNSV